MRSKTNFFIVYISFTDKYIKNIFCARLKLILKNPIDNKQRRTSNKYWCFCLRAFFETRMLRASKTDIKFNSMGFLLQLIFVSCGIILSFWSWWSSPTYSEFNPRADTSNTTFASHGRAFHPLQLEHRARATGDTQVDRNFWYYIPEAGMPP